jgi:carboxyl-terminal processing protease
VRKHFYDSERAEAWASAYVHYAAGIKSQAAFATLTNEVLEQLNTSHTHLYTPLDPEYYSLRVIFRESLGVDSVEYESIGVDFTHDYFVSFIFAGGPAARAGLQRGDKILKANGRQFHPVLSLRGRADRQIVLTVERYKGQSKLEVQVVPRKIDPAQEWLDAQQLGSKLIRRRSKSIAYIPLFSCAGERYKTALYNTIVSKFQDAHALILDFRDGWGGMQSRLLELV